MAKAKEFELHPAAEIFPLLKHCDPEVWKEFLDDMRENGQQEPIALCEGKVLDGRNRLLGCQALGLEPKTINVRPASPVKYVISRNLHRRHLTIGQYSGCAARSISMFEAEAAERKAKGQKKGGAATAKKALGKHLPQAIEADGTVADEANAKLAEAATGKAVDMAGKAFGVSGENVRKAAAVIGQASPEVTRLMDHGEITVNVATKLADLPKAKQAEAVAQIKRGEKPKALKIKRAKSGGVAVTHKDLREQLGKLARLVDALEKKHPGGKFSRGIHDRLKACHGLVADWQRSPNSAQKD